MGNLGEQGAREVLFRPHAILIARSRLGVPVRPVGLASWALLLFMIVLLATVITFMCVTRYARKEAVVGIVQPVAGSARLSPSRSAVVQIVHVREGQLVRKGDPIVTLSSTPSMADGRSLSEVYAISSLAQNEAMARQASARRALFDRQRDEIAAKRASIKGQQARLVQDIEIQRKRVELAEQTLHAAEILAEKQLLSLLQLRQREEALLAARLALSSMLREHEELPNTIAQLAAQDQRLIAEAEGEAASIAANSAALAERQAANQADSQIVLSAHASGRVASLQAVAGGVVSASSTLAILVPEDGGLQAQLWVPSRAVGFVRPGDKVRLMYDAFPYQRFGVGKGRVAEVARAPTSPIDLPPSLKAEEDLYRVVVSIDDETVTGYGKRWALAPGMRLQADLILEQQSLLAWLFDKVRAAQTRAAPL